MIAKAKAKHSSLIKRAIIKRPESVVGYPGDDEIEFGKGKFFDHPGTNLDAVFDAIRYAISELEKPGKTNLDRIDISRFLLAEISAQTFRITGSLNAIEFMYSSEIAFREYCSIAEEIQDRFLDEDYPHYTWLRFAYADTIRKDFNRGLQKNATTPQKMNSMHIKESFIKIGWGSIEKYLNPKAEDWAHENSPGRVIKEATI